MPPRCTHSCIFLLWPVRTAFITYHIRCGHSSKSLKCQRVSFDPFDQRNRNPYASFKNPTKFFYRPRSCQARGFRCCLRDCCYGIW